MLHDRSHYDKVPLLHDHCPHYDKELSCSIGALHSVDNDDVTS